MDIFDNIKLPPWDIREYRFFILYKPDPSIPAFQIQLEDGKTYEVHFNDLEKVPQFTRLPLWESLYRKACSEGKAVYYFGEEGPEGDKLLDIPVESAKYEQANVARGLRDDAIYSVRASRAERKFQNCGFGGRPALRHFKW